MAVTITVNPKFKHLSADRSYTAKPGGVGVEKEMICDINITGATDFATGLATVNFTQVGLKQVYACAILEQDDFALNTYQFVEAANSDAATAQIKGKVTATNVDVANSTTVVLKVLVRGV